MRGASVLARWPGSARARIQFWIFVNVDVVEADNRPVRRSGRHGSIRNVGGHRFLGSLQVAKCE